MTITFENTQKNVLNNFLGTNLDLIPARNCYLETPFIDDIVIHVFRFLSIKKRISPDLSTTCYQFYKISKMLRAELNHSLNQACSFIVKDILEISYYKQIRGASLTAERTFYYNFDSFYSSLKILNPYKPIRTGYFHNTKLDHKSFLLKEQMIYEFNETYTVERSGVISLCEGHVLKQELQLVAKQAAATLNRIRGMQGT